MGDFYLDARLDALRRSQNPDGGWPYFAGKQSWLEPTVYAALALDGEPAADRAWKLLKSWQMRSGAVRPAADVQVESWATALCVTLSAARGEFGEPFERAVQWLLKTQGEDSNLLTRAASAAGLFKPDRNPHNHGWPWKPGTSSWVEPTAHALVALKLASAKLPDKKEVAERIRTGQAALFDLRASDGGWNYGNRTVWGVDLPSYPETTALALIGLQSSGATDVLEAARKINIERVSPLARAWLAIALRLYGVETPAPAARPTPDLLLTAVEALGCANYRYFKTGGEA